MFAQARKKLRSQISPDYKYQTMALTVRRGNLVRKGEYEKWKEEM